MHDKFEQPEVGVFFGKSDKPVTDPYFNGEGPSRKGCNFCGACMTGCRNNAKNSLDKNYLYLAQKMGTEILSENEVIDVIPLDNLNGSNGYSVVIQTSTSFIKKKKELVTKGLVFSGGTMGTVKLMLKLKQQSLPNLSNRIGCDIRTNNETLVSVSTLNKDLDISQGIAIGSILHTDENSHLEVVRYAKGSGFWKTFHIPYATGKHVMNRFFNIIIRFLKSPFSYFKIYFFNDWAKSTAVLLFMQTVDTRLRFKRNIFGIMSSSVTSRQKPTPDIPESIELTKKYGKIINGKPSSFIIEGLGGIPSTAHILGGAVMGKDITKGVIDKYNKVFGYDNMFIIDGSMISANPGVNPSLSITAIAEKAMDRIVEKPDKSLLTSKLFN